MVLRMHMIVASSILTTVDGIMKVACNQVEIHANP